MNTVRWRVLGLLAGVALIAAPVLAQPRSRPARPSRGRVQLKVGRQAPDVELHPLTFEKNDKGELVGKIGAEWVKLSDFKGKAPICIFSSSYT
jgi:hypothetical protein